MLSLAAAEAQALDDIAVVLAAALAAGPPPLAGQAPSGGGGNGAGGGKGKRGLAEPPKPVSLKCRISSPKP
jgi:hypothetical protein